MSSATYRTLLRTPSAAAFFLTAAVGRVGIAMTGLGIVWLVHSRTGSYATAGLVTGGFAVAEAIAGPQLARLIDRFGQTRVLPPALVAHAAAVATLLALVAAGTPDWVMTAGGVLAGATIPQLGALSAARWAALLRDERAAALPTAFTLEALANELSYLVGPVLVSILGATGHPALGTTLAGTLVVAGGLSFAAQRRTAPPPASAASAHNRTSRSLLRRGFAVLAGVNLAIGVFFGATGISVTAFAVEHRVAGAAAALFTVSGCASLLAGWLYGLRRWRTAPRVQLAVAAAGLAAGCLPLLVADSPLELGFGIALTGLAIPPLLVSCSVLTELAVHRAVLTQAFVWLNSASAAGSAGATAVAGWAVGAFGAHGGFAVAAMAAGVIAALTVTGLRALPMPKRQLTLRQDEPLDGAGEALVGVGGGDPPGRALHVWAGIAHRDTQPRVREHQHVVGHVADGGDGLRRDRVLGGHVPGDRAFVGVRVGDIQVVRLGPGRGHVVSELVVGGGRGARHRVEVVADTDQFRDIAGEAVQTGHNLRLEPDRRGFLGHVRALRVRDIPVGAAVNPGVQAERLVQVGHGHHQFFGDHALLDHRHVRIDQYPAVERGDRGRDGQRLDEHGHAPRRTAAGDGEQDPGLAELVYGFDGPVGQDLVRGHERAVDVRQKQPDRTVHEVPPAVDPSTGTPGTAGRPVTTTGPTGEQQPSHARDPA
jgi:hypothetical protein